MKSYCLLISLTVVVLLPGAAAGALFDWDDDGDIDLVDFQALVDCMDGPEVPISPTCTVFDENEDTYVDLHDFRGVQLVFGAECSLDIHCDDGYPCTVDTCADSVCEYAFAPDTTECRPAEGECDVAEYCTGASADCPADEFAPDTTECRGLAGDCDAAEYCTGTSVDCPADEFATETSECRGMAGDCDIAEYCTGGSVDCPPDEYEPEGTPCPDGLFCNGEDTCDGAGACESAGDPCTDPAFPFCDEVNDECIEDQGEIISAQLAGNWLAEYPFFEYVKAFNENAVVLVAVDPTRFPDIVGLTCDVYMVEAKTAGQWQGDPALVDVTAGGPQTETFGGSTIQENSHLVVGPYELDSAVYDENTNAYTGLGHPYDMVLDCNQNGQLDGGDYIDGFSREAGLYIVHDTSEQGPLAVTELPVYSVGAVFGIPSNKTYEDTYYPTDIASMGELPLIIISRGNGHQYTWYDHIGYHMASYGYIVMSHDNNTEPGVLYASLTTLGHTDAFLDQLDGIGGGVLEGHVDSSRITWIGHSRGAEGVAIAYDRITDASPSYTPTHYSPEDITLISSMLPTDFQGPNIANPHEANYHLWTASGDADVNGGADCNLCQTFHLHDRATRFRQSTVIQGTGHGDFHTASGSVFTGPCHITPQETVHDIMQGYFLPLIKHYIEGNIPATDFLWRQYERFHPIGIDLSNPCIVVTNEYRNGAEDGNFFIDDYQSEYDDTHTSSSGGSVSYTVENLTEGRLDDNNSSFSWTPSDPFNGATQAGSADTGADSSKGVVFDWTDEDLYYEWEVIEEQGDFSDDLYISFRGAQGTQHPNTLAVLGDETFSLTLRDGTATTSSINIGAYGGGLEQPYQRSGGWHNEMEVIRIRLTDFLTNGSGLDLTNIVAVRFDVGPSWGSNEGRIVVDELMLTNDHPPYFIPVTIGLTAAAPQFLPPDVPTVIEVEIFEGTDMIVPDTALLHYRYDSGTWLTAPLVQVAPGSELYEATLPAPSCGDTPEFYFSVEGSITGVVYDPSTAPATPYTAFVGVYDAIFSDDFESDQGWTVEDDPSLTDGSWERGLPFDEPDPTRRPPSTDYDGSGNCYLTANRIGNSDVDEGPTWLISPTIDMSGNTDPVLRYARWWYNDDQDGDEMTVEVSNDDGDTWHVIETVSNIPEAWVERTVYITNYVTPLTNQMKVRFSATDSPNNSKDEGGIDAVDLFEVLCSE